MFIELPNELESIMVSNSLKSFHIYFNENGNISNVRFYDKQLKKYVVLYKNGIFNLSERGVEVEK